MSSRPISERLGCVARQGYGATEATCTISAPLGRPSTPATAGWLMPGTEARLVDPFTGEDVEPGEPGELWIRGPQVMQGYYGRPRGHGRRRDGSTAGCGPAISSPSARTASS